MASTALDEQFLNSAQFTVVDNRGEPQAFVSDGWYDYFGLLDAPTSTFTGFAGSSQAGYDIAPMVPTYFGFTLPFLVANDLDGEGGFEPFVLIWDAVDISRCASVLFSGKFA